MINNSSCKFKNKCELFNSNFHNCKLGGFNPKTNYYFNCYDELNILENNNNKLPRGLKYMMEVLGFLKKLKGEYNLLEVGASGNILRYLLPKNIKYHSCDCFKPQDYICNLDYEILPFENDSFDIIICLETLEHIINPKRVMKEFKRVVKKNGMIIVSIPNDYNFVLRFYYLFGIKKKNIDQSFEVVNKNLHIHRVRVKDILKFLGRYLKIREIKFVWISGKSNNHVISDEILNLLAKLKPSLFARIVLVFGINKK